jgi:hypothetical protein
MEQMNLESASLSLDSLLRSSESETHGRKLRISGDIVVQQRRKRRSNLFFITVTVGSGKSSFPMELKCKLQRNGIDEPCLEPDRFHSSFVAATAGATLTAVDGELEVFGGATDDWQQMSSEGVSQRRCRWACGDIDCAARTGGSCAAELPVLRCTSLTWKANETSAPVNGTPNTAETVGADGAPWLLFDMVKHHDV